MLLFDWILLDGVQLDFPDLLLQQHCRTAATTRGLRDTGGDQQRCNYVTSFLSLYGQAVGLHLSPRYAAESPS